MRTVIWLVCLIPLLLFPAVHGNAQVKRFVHIEISAGDRAAVRSQQKWMEVLSEVGADRVRSRTSGASGRVEIKESETSLGVLVKVFGRIDRNRLELPGATFGMADRQALEQYVQQLRDDGAGVALAEKKAFGLTSQQLVALSESLAVPLDMETKNRPASEFVDVARRQVSFEFVLDKASRRAIGREEAFPDELQGMSVGTSLAAALRPLGLVLVPRRQPGQETALHLVDAAKAEEYWPVGWPATTVPKRTVPALFDKNALEIRDFPLDKVLSAIQAKSGVPMLLDYKAIAAAGIDLATTKVTFVGNRSSYGFGLRKVLGQTEPRMTYEIRVDDAGRPFLWLTTARPAS